MKRIFFREEQLINDQPINDLIKQYDEVRKVSTENGDNLLRDIY